MNKILLKLAIASSVLMLSTSAFAAEISNTDSTTIYGATFKASTGVSMEAAASKTAWAAGAKHLNGDTCYGATSIEPTIKSSKVSAKIGEDFAGAGGLVDDTPKLTLPTADS